MDKSKSMSKYIKSCYVSDPTHYCKTFLMLSDKFVIALKRKRCFGFTPERWISLSCVALTATKNLAFFCSDWTANFPFFWLQKIYSPGYKY